jgi:hypothetical protein
MSLPPSEIPQGAIRFNTDSQRLEFYAQGEWWVMSTDTPNLGRDVDSTPGARGAWAGGNTNPVVHGDIEYINIASTGNSVDFGANITTRRRASAFASSTRMVVNGGATPSPTGVQEFLTFASTGTVTAWGDTLSTAGSCDNAAFGNQTRGITKSGYTSPGASGTMDYCTIASEGNTQDFGDLIANGDAPGGFSNSTRGVLGGSYEPANDNTITFVTIATLGNARDFGDLTLGRYSIAGGVSNKTRGLFGGGNRRSPAPAGQQDVIDYVTISSGGNATNFGELLENRGTASGVSNCIRGVYGGGYASPTNRIQYLQIATEGNAVDFGDLSVRSGGKGAAASNAHGGL